MRRHRFVIGLWIEFLTAGIIFTGSSWAQIRSGLEWNPYLGASFGKGGMTQMVDYASDRFIRSNMNRNGIAAGLRVVLNTSPRFGLEMMFGISTNRYQAILYDAGDQRDETNSLFLGFLSMNGIFYLTTSNIVPFVTAGMDIIGFSEKGILGFNIGGGLKLFLTRRLSLNFDVRFFPATFDNSLEEMVDYNSRWGEIETGWVKVPYSERIHSLQMTIGLSFFPKQTRD